MSEPRFASGESNAAAIQRSQPATAAEAAKPLVSIIIPSYNQGRFIRAAIESCLAQDHRPIEIVVVDGASTDETVDVLRSFSGAPEVNWTSERDKGVADAVNKGLRLAHGSIAGIQSSDDAYLPGAVSAAAEEFRADSELGLVYSNWVYVDADGCNERRYLTGPYSLEDFLCANTLIPQHAAFFRLNLARAVGGWNEKYFVADTEMWLRMAFRARFRKVEAFWGVRRMHGEQRNNQARRIVESHARMVAESADLEKAPPRLQRAANCGRFLAAARYNPRGRRFPRLLNFWRAYLAYPPVRSSQSLTAELIPCYWRLPRGRGLIDSMLRKLDSTLM